MSASSQSIKVELLDRARALVPTLRARAAAGEEARRMPKETVADLVSSGILRLCQPARFGGHELGWDALCELALAMGKGDGSQAWVANIYAEHVMFAGLFPDQAQQEVWANGPDVIISASIVPQGNKAERVPGGFRLSGRWSFASGCHHAQWLMLAELVEGVPTFFLVPAADLTIDDDWRTMGMAGTGSHSLLLQGVFVPDHRTLSNRDVAAGEAPGAAFNPGFVYRMPILAFAQLPLASVVVGAADGMVEDFAAFIKSRATAPSGELLQEVLAEAASEVDAAKLVVLDRARRNMAILAGGGRLGEPEAAHSARDSAFATRLARAAASRLFEATGGHGLYLTAPMQRAYRDVLGGGGHGSLNWPRSALRYAKLILGI